MASESAFNTSGRILESYRRCLTHYMIEILMCTEQWLHADIKLKETIITNEQILADVEEFDKLEKGMNSFALLFYLFARIIGHVTDFCLPLYQSLKLTILMIEVWILKVEGWRLKFQRVFIYLLIYVAFFWLSLG